MPLSEFVSSGISQAELARRLGKGADVISRTLASVGNVILDTLAEYIYASNGGIVNYKVEYLDKEEISNHVALEWLKLLSFYATFNPTKHHINQIAEDKFVPSVTNNTIPENIKKFLYPTSLEVA